MQDMTEYLEVDASGKPNFDRKVMFYEDPASLPAQFTACVLGNDDIGDDSPEALYLIQTYGEKGIGFTDGVGCMGPIGDLRFKKEYDGIYTAQEGPFSMKMVFTNEAQEASLSMTGPGCNEEIRFSAPARLGL